MHNKNKQLIRRWDSERKLPLRPGTTTVLDRHQIRLRVRVSMAVRFGSVSYDIVHAVQNTIDSCINSDTDRRGYVLEQHRFTIFSDEITSFASYGPIFSSERGVFTEQSVTSHQTHYMSYRDYFSRSYDLTNSIKALKEASWSFR